MPVIGFLHPSSPEPFADRPRAFRQGLKEAGFVEGENVAIEYRWADNQNDRLPTLTAELVRRQVAVIAVGGGILSASAAKTATTTIPLVFVVGDDPVKLGLVANLARPGGNATGMNFFVSEVVPKRLGLLRDLVPGAVRIAAMINPGNAVTAETTVRELQKAAGAFGLQIQIVNAANSREIEAAFATISRERAQALFVAADAFFASRRVQFATLASRNGIPATYSRRDYIEVGGLMSYGTDIVDNFRQVGVYAGKILNGEKPSELPVMQSTKFELVVNLVTARALGVTMPPTLLARADEVIE
jgi:putative ABC transport system substrate-binding protein